MKTDVLITRPMSERSAAFETALTEHGLTLHHTPLFTYTAPDITAVPNGNYAALIATSAQAFKHIKFEDSIFSTPIYCVSETTALAARDTGFQDIITANGTAQGIADIIIPSGGGTSPPQAALYLRGKDIAFDMKSVLGEHNIPVNEFLAYTTEAETALPLDVQDAFKNASFRAVTFFSKRTAQIFMDLAVKHNLTAHLNHVYALCISESVLKCLTSKNSNWKGVYVSKTPDQNGMISLARTTLNAGAEH